MKKYRIKISEAEYLQLLKIAEAGGQTVSTSFTAGKGVFITEETQSWVIWLIAQWRGKD